MVSYVLFGVALLNAGVGLLVFFRNVRRVSNITFGLLSFFVAAWAFCVGAFLLSNDSQTAVTLARFYYISPIIICASLTLFSLSFPGNSSIKPSKYLVIILVPLVLIALSVALPGFLITGVTIGEPSNTVVLNMVHYSLYSAYIASSFAIGLYVMHKKMFDKNRIHAKQARTFFIGCGSAALFGLVFNLLLPALGNYNLIWVGPLTTTIYVISNAISIVRYKMFDVRLVVARTLGYVFSLILVALFYGYIVLGLVNAVVSLQLTMTAQVSISIVMAFASMSFPSLKKFFDHVTNKLFFRDTYDSRELLDHLNRIFISTVDIEELLESIAKTIAGTLNASYCLIGVADASKEGHSLYGTEHHTFDSRTISYVQGITPSTHRMVLVADELGAEHADLKQILIKNGITLLVRITPDVSETGIGYIVLGAKKSGNNYTSHDYKVLGTIGRQLTIGVKAALQYKMIQQFNETLQQKVDEATRKLRRSNTKLQNLDETKDEFISMASHQLRTPLTSVKGYLSMVLDGDAGEVTETQRKLLNQAYVSSQRMVYTIADLLNVSRLKTGKFIIERSPVNLSDVVQQEITSLAEAALAKNITLSYSPPDFCPPLMLDDTKIRQVIMNFIDNAIYYTPAKGTITVSIAATAKMLELKVVDTGMGVPTAAQPHMFTKFYRASNAQKARPDGTGLGLFMAKKIIIAQGGSLIFKSQEGKGSAFGFSFPLIRE